jgi:hypothetical protein
MSTDKWIFVNISADLIESILGTTGNEVLSHKQM